MPSPRKKGDARTIPQISQSMSRSSIHLLEPRPDPHLLFLLATLARGQVAHHYPDWIHCFLPLSQDPHPEH